MKIKGVNCPSVATPAQVITRLGFCLLGMVLVSTGMSSFDLAKTQYFGGYDTFQP